jgi:hypothetical protein
MIVQASRPSASSARVNIKVGYESTAGRRARLLITPTCAFLWIAFLSVRLLQLQPRPN